MQTSHNPAVVECQVNVKFSREDLESVKRVAQTHGMTLSHYCRAAALDAHTRDLPPTETPFFNAVAALLGNLPADIVSLRNDLTQARKRDAAALSEITLRALATLEEVHEVRIILINMAGVVGRGHLFTDAAYAEVKATAKRVKGRNAQRSLDALTARLQTPAETSPETSHNPAPDNAHA